ncbi:hypothetical protein VTH06DRAFT_7586 [Thermothelomyces fergusii]
MSITIKTV